MKLSKDALSFKEALEASKVVAFPTETVMGLGVFYDDYDAYNALNGIKRRPEDKPYTMMLGNVLDIEKYAYLSNRDKKIINAFMPGPLTILVRSKNNVPPFVTHGTGIIGIRVPGMPEICELINSAGKPLLVPSANRSFEKPCLTYEEVIKEFAGEVSYIYPKDALGDKPSTIVDLTGENIKIIREGSISLEDIERSLL